MLLTRVKRWKSDNTFLKKASKKFDIAQLSPPENKQDPELFLLRRKGRSDTAVAEAVQVSAHEAQQVQPCAAILEA